jgi:predicted NACHT family NTPase
MDIDKILGQLFADLLKNAAGITANAIGAQAHKLLELYRKDLRPYLENTILKCSFIKTIISREVPVRLIDIYVPPRLRHGNRFFDEFMFLEGLPKRKRVLIVGSAGSGKSVFLRYLFLTQLERSGGRVPLFIELREINSSPETELLRFMLRSITGPGAIITEDQFKDGLREGLFTLILDGFDEVDHDRRASVVRQLLQLQERYPEVIVVVSSRPEQTFAAWTTFFAFSLQPMEKRQIVSLIQKMDYDRALKNKFIRALNGGLFEKHNSFLSNPLLALMMLITFDQYAEIPEKMYVFYDYAFDALFIKHDAAKYGGYKRKSHTGLAIDDFKKCLSSFCLLSYLEKKLIFLEAELRAYLGKALKYENIRAGPGNLYRTIGGVSA